ncbi:MAG: serine hydrolase [Oscillospiraceae bacterium]|nr:serine hydrolase [Oscillospiraceae bacterium]
MKRNRWSALALTLLLVLTLAVPAQATESGRAETVDVPVDTAAREAAEGAMTYGSADSITWAMWEDGEITVSGGIANQRDPSLGHLAGLSALSGDLYGIGSVSKIFTTVAVMQLSEQGKLSLDAPVTRYLPSFKMADARYKDITVRMLLNHSSGLMGSSLENAMLFDDADPSATNGLLDRLATQRLKADPGAYSVYCNDGFTLAELVVEAVAKQDFMDYVSARILAPAKLQDVYAPGGDFAAGRLAPIYHGTDTRPLPQDCLNAVGAGGLYADAGTLAAFGGALTGNTLLRQSSLDTMAAPEYDRGIWPDDTLDMLAFGLGWDNVEWYPFSQSGITALVKGGDTLYYHAGLVVLPEYHMAAAVLSSGGASTYNELAATEILLTALKAKGVEVDETVPALPETAPAAMPSSLLDNAGYYGATSAQYQVALSADGALTMRCLTYPGIPAQSFTYCGDGSFRDATGTALVRFVTEDNGEIYLYQKAVSPIPGLGALPISNYAAVKMEDNALSAEAQAAWDTLNATSVLPVSEKYSSELYLAIADAAAQEGAQTTPGYIGASRIADAEYARYELQLPGVGGRDGQDWRLLQKDGGTWIEVNGSLYMPENAAPALYTGSGWSYATVQEDGYARWFHVGTAAGKTMKVQLPEDAGFWVYDGNGQVTASSVLWDDAAAVLPEDGLVVFAGDAGARFHLTFR